MNLTIQSLSKSYGGRTIFKDFSLDLQAGVRLCVCGPNGCGKSTLLRMLAGLDEADSGRVILQRGARLGYVEQELDSNILQTPLLDWVLEVLPAWHDFWEEWEKATAANDQNALLALSARQNELEQVYGYNPEHRARTVLSGLGFSSRKWSQPLAELSGGWRERAKLARVLTAGADVLLLDEPTNHLDLEAVEWLEEFLLAYKGVLIFVAHDRIFMDRVGTHVLYLGGSKPEFRRGSFSEFVERQEELEGQREREAQRLQSEIERKMDFVRRFGVKATKARQAASRQKMAKRLEKELDGLTPEPRRKELDFSWPEPSRAEKLILNTADLAFSFPDGTTLWPPLSFSLYRGQKIALVGPNGCGKSTLLRLLTGRLQKSGGNVVMGSLVRMGFFSQHQMDTLNPDSAVLAEIRRLSDPRTTEEELMSVLGLFLLGQNYFDRLVGTLSGGEKSRLILASLFLGRYNFLILDEPTNHLDLESREALIEALQTYTGTLLMVAHDRWLLANAADEAWLLSPGGIVRYESGFAEYEAAHKAGLLTPQETESSSPSASLSRDDQKRLKREQADRRNALYKRIKPKQDAYAKLEAELDTALAEQADAEAKLADPVVYADSAEATRLLLRFKELQAAGERLMDKLAVLEAEIAELEAQRSAIAAD